MHVQVVTYALDGMPESDYLDLANELAPSFSGIPGLQAKIWLDDPDRGRYGAVYFWDDKAAMERFLHSNLFEGTNPEFTDVESEGFAILENLTAHTQPVLVVGLPRRGRAPSTSTGPVKQPGKAAAKAPAPAPAKKAKTGPAGGRSRATKAGTATRARSTKTGS
jgi:heme-degrading monooxygenase HmoA